VGSIFRDYMAKNVMIAYGSRYGCTEEVSKEIGKTLESAGITIKIINLGGLKESDIPSIENFDGVLVGSGIKVGKWTNEADLFIDKNKDRFKDKVFGMFACAGFVANDPEKSKEMYVEEKIQKLGLNPDIYDIFGGVFDLSWKSKAGFMDRKIMSIAAKGLEREKGIKIEKKGKNDFRDWNQIKLFTLKFAELVKSK